MTHVLIKNEFDMEFGIQLAVALAITNKRFKSLEMTFPSEGMMKIFLSNLYSEFIVNSVPLSHGLEIKLNIPVDDELGDDGELLE